jgi:DNA-binding beta-propeller fold protein YncE
MRPAVVTPTLALGSAAAVLASVATAGTVGATARPARPSIAYVVNYNDGTVTPVNTVTRKAGRPIPMPESGQHDGATAIAITPNGKTAWTLDADTVTPISTATNKAGRPIKVGSGPIAIAFTP